MEGNNKLTNLDVLAAQTAQTIVQMAVEVRKVAAKDLDNLATKTLGVLQENGPYAMALFLASRSREVDKKIAGVIQENLFSQEMLTALFGNGISLPSNNDGRLKFLANEVANDLNRLLLLKQVWEQTLIYVRYGAKARG